MPCYIHSFRCTRCGRHVDYRNQADDSGETVPSLLHDELAQVLVDTRNGRAVPNIAAADAACSGRLLYHSTAMVALALRVDAPVDAEWNAFVAAVRAAWRAFKNAGYPARLRGPNFDRAYRMPAAVSARLRSAGGEITIGNASYKVAPSKTTDVALHRTLTKNQGSDGTYQSFVFHL